MTYVEMRHSGISHDLKIEMEIIPRIGEVVDFIDGEDHHIFVVDRVVHVYEGYKLEKIYISGKQRRDWST
ncbi:hypothetical protein RCO27_10825 [Sphingosinicella sp. LHD-64]|uniref:hypothetical protein n=1 Tax=Sphingosinicella sp. LHD-64 TaxID=3072139 RepID=UPI0028104F0C|nr:hypothetical protein [Sphingosinicella sp. LHD-64]MDQ8756721.1 hypothetical protein [Sphingosinicella sp. LHD-64]